MSDKAAVVHIGENSPEEVAFKLLQTVASVEGKSLFPFRGGDVKPDRKWILDTYAECLAATRGFRSI